NLSTFFAIYNINNLYFIYLKDYFFNLTQFDEHSLFEQLFTKQNNGIFVKSELLTTLENNEIYLPEISIIIAKSGADAPESLNSLFNKLFILNPNYNPTIAIDINYTFYTEYVSANKKYIESPICTTFKKYMGIPKTCSLLSGSGVNIKNTMETLFNLLFIENNNNYVPIPNININSLDRNDLIKIIKEKHDAIVNSEELGSRSDGVMPISNRQVMSDDFTNFSSLVEGLNILCNENAWYPLLEGIGGAELKTLSTREIERIIGDIVNSGELGSRSDAYM
ncbi:hypothetical protein, partial [Rickettsia endosymbiont of Culicoides newsteadi]|uniref:hypothetical protein n=1 Tax=Rickettsia endosymbiont of Culicoides newsteadi TaxID=1961830 RepID=UPI00195B224A